MKTKLPALAAAVLAAAAPLHAASIVASDPVPNTFGPAPDFATLDGGVGYAWQATLSGTDSGSFQTHTGAWSWEDNSLFNAGAGEPPVGWTHTSVWVALRLLSPTTFTLRLERQEGVPWPSPADPGRLAGTTSYFPSLSFYSGWDGDGSDHHTYNNRGAVAWAEDITYLTHIDNSTLSSIEGTWTLPAGDYSLALGSNAPATDPSRQGFRATFITVPEPGSCAALMLGAAMLIVRRRR